MEDVPAPAAAAAESKEAAAADDGAAAASDSAAAAETKAAPKEKKPRAPRAPKVKAPAAAASSVDAAAAAGTSSRGRERKAVQHFAPESIKKEEIEFIVEEGPGTKLGEIENIKRKMDATNAQDTSLKCLFAACFPEQKGGNTKLVIKKHIREFSGYPKANASDLKESASTKIERYDGATLKAVCQILDISESGTKAKHIERITEFLESPESSGKAYSGGHVATSGSKRKSGSSTKGKDGKEKRGMTSFMLFSQEFREDVRAKNPDIAITAIASKLGEMWRALSESKKQKYKDAAAALKEGKSGKKASSGSDSDSSSGSEEEEEEQQETKPKKKAKSEPSAPSMSDELRAQLSASVEEVLKDADLTQMSMAKVRALLQQKHGELIVETHKLGIRDIVVAAIAAKTGKKE